MFKILLDFRTNQVYALNNVNKSSLAFLGTCYNLPVIVDLVRLKISDTKNGTEFKMLKVK